MDRHDPPLSDSVPKVAGLPAAATRLLHVWFETAGREQWFAADPAFDETLKSEFGALQQAAEAGALDFWSSTSSGALALVLLLDQLPRNLYRGEARAFASDDRARTVADAAIARGFDQAVPPIRRAFFYLPFEHGESFAAQDRAVSLFRSIADDWPEAYDYARRHREVIARFGRFPQRNDVLGRPSSEDEKTFLADPENLF